MAPPPHELRRKLLAPLVWLAAAIFLVEEFIWDWTGRMMARLGALRAVHAVERRIAALPPRWALPAFILPSLIIIPAKLIGVEALSSGHWLAGSATFLVAKLLGFGLFSRIFSLTRPALMQLAWFAGMYAWVMRYRNRIHAYLDNWAAYQRIKRRLRALLTRVRAGLAGLRRDAE